MRQAQMCASSRTTFLCNHDDALTAALSALQDDQISKTVADSPNEFWVCRPCQCKLSSWPPPSSVGRWKRSNREARKSAPTTMGALLMTHAGTAMGGGELDAFIMVHPAGVAAAERLRSYYPTNLIGNPLDTTIAAAALVFSGVIER